MIENWKVITGFDNYFISSLGRVKSKKYKEPRILKQSYVDRRNGKKLYAKVVLVKGSKTYTKTIHTIMAETFLGYIYNKNDDKIIDHIDNNSLNNTLDNLQIISCRKNLYKDRNFPGAHWSKRSNNWKSQVYFNKKNIHLGTFNSKEKASEMYIKAVTEIENNTFNTQNYRKCKMYEKI